MTTETWLGAKDSAAVIRGVLRKNFPGCKFSVTIGRGSGVSSVHIKWTDGPTPARVEALTSGFQAGTFDGMTDSYNYDRDAFVEVDGKLYRPGARYIFTERHVSPRATLRALDAVLARNWAWARPEIGERVTALRDRLAAELSRDAVNALHNDGFTIYPGDAQNIRHGRTLSQMVNLAARDRTEVEPAGVLS